MGADREVVVSAGASAGTAVANPGAPVAAPEEAAASGVGPAHGAAVDGATGPAGTAVCANCGAPVSGHFCSNCGQRVEHSVHSVWHFAGEAFEDLTHADSRLWGTVGALLFKPGFLTCEFLAGRRVKYLPPLRLYLVLSLLFFVVAAYDSDNTVLILMAPGGDQSLAANGLYSVVAQ